ncbi:MAG: hypothetical protein Q8Q90_01855 [bacterium]|nr:hypothetical protein [bacterium]
MDNNISLIPKEESGSNSLPKFSSFKSPDIELSSLSKLGLGLVAILLLITAGFYFWKYQLNNQAKAFNTELQSLTSQRDVSLENRLKNLNSVLEIFKGVLDEHRYWTLFFDVLEAKTLNSVTFKTLETSDTDSTINMSGSAPSYGVLAQQVKILEDTPNIVSVTSSNIALSAEGKVNFGLKIVFSKDLIIKK